MHTANFAIKVEGIGNISTMDMQIELYCILLQMKCLEC